MKYGWVIGVGALLLCGISLPVAASEEPSFPAPRSLGQHQDEEGTKFYVATAYASRVWDKGLIGNENLLRRAKPLTNADKIWRATDLAITSLTQSRGQPRTTAIMALDIDADGRVARCAAQDGNNNDVVLAAQACPVIKERMRFTPALELDGRPAPDRFSYRLSFRHVGVRSGNAPPAFQPLFSSPAPWPVPDTTKPEVWPILSEHPRGFRAGAAKRPVPLAPVALGRDEKAVGIAFSLTKKDMRKDCVVVVPSGDTGLDESACDFMRKRHEPLLGTSYLDKTTMPYLVVGNGKAKRAVAPVGRLAKRGKLDAESAELTRNLLDALFQSTGGTLETLAFAFSVDATGRLTDCRINSSSGSDTGDAKACDIARENLRYVPATDIFGQPAMMRRQGWFARRR